MNTIVIIILVTAVLLAVCFVACLVIGKGDRRKLRATNLVLPLLVLLMFVGLFVGSGISRSHIRKELSEMQESLDTHHASKGDYQARLEELEGRNESLNRLIGRDKEIESRFASLRASGSDRE